MIREDSRTKNELGIMHMNTNGKKPKILLAKCELLTLVLEG